MMYLWSLIYVLVLLLCGAATVIVTLGPNRRSVLELLGLAIPLGAGVVSTLLIWISILGFKPSKGIIISVGVVALVCLVVSGMKRGWPVPIKPAFRRPVWTDLALLVPLGCIVASVFLVAILSLRFDFFEGDSVLIWGFKAKVLFYDALRPKPFALTDRHYSYIHQDYPLLVSMLIAAAYAMIGHLNEGAGKIVFPLFFAAQAMLGFVAARRWLSTLRALLATALLICIPFTVLFSGAGNADAILETFYLGSLVYLIRWIEESRPEDLVFSAIFCTFGAMTKQEGMPLALIQMAVAMMFILFRRNTHQEWRTFALSIAILTIGAGSWWIWRTGLPHTTDNYDSRFRVSILFENFGRLGRIMQWYAGEMMNIQEWGALWLLLPLSAAIGFRAFFTPQTIVLWMMFVLHLGLYFIAHIVSIWEADRLLNVSTVRLLLHVAPAAMLLIALHWRAAAGIVSPVHELRTTS